RNLRSKNWNRIVGSIPAPARLSVNRTSKITAERKRTRYVTMVSIDTFVSVQLRSTSSGDANVVDTKVESLSVEAHGAETIAVLSAERIGAFQDDGGRRAR